MLSPSSDRENANVGEAGPFMTGLMGSKQKNRLDIVRMEPSWSFLNG